MLLERVLAPTEKPAGLVKRRLEQAGYDAADGLQTLGSDEIGFLIKFIYKSNLLGGKEVSGSIKIICMPAKYMVCLCCRLGRRSDDRQL